MCKEHGCKTQDCRRLSHHGASMVFPDCPRCGLDHWRDYARLMGVGCGKCGYYLVPEWTPWELKQNANPWEWPGERGP
jgi:ribosomal protein S27AE